MKKVWILLLAAVLILSAAGCTVSIENASVGDEIRFGKYEQDNDLLNGKEDIEWIVLAKEDDRILVISKYALDRVSYNDVLTDVTWEICSLRRWLNGSFLNEAFSVDEQNRILSATVRADRNPHYSWVTAGKDTTDKVFLLSYPEAQQYFSSDEARRCVPTDYALARGAQTSDKYSVKGKETTRWWLRTPGDYSCYALGVDVSGLVLRRGDTVNGDVFSVRPAWWIKTGS
jgi:hypothetical protein